ncbi:hypothetical protein C5167_006932 [Papaver somniferum]|uniref:Amidohydrolase-related domain-containing protein n=1 Tax=Papaver somniferum TaxID=3469 RepID=A0A4Y7JIZ0_PAPSO|nr:hypothetical protein C5167_006932 [Papaver somniferum]
MDDQERVFKDGAIVIDGDKIIAINQSSLILAEFGTTGHDDVDIINLNGKIVIPGSDFNLINLSLLRSYVFGLINTHVHTSQQLGRGIADDVDLMTWLHKRIWPYESNMTEEDSYISTLLCGIELIHYGGQHVSGMARAVELLGLRACLVQSAMVVRAYQKNGVFSRLIIVFRLNIQSVLFCGFNRDQSRKELYAKHRNSDDGRIKMWFGIRKIMNATDKLLFETRDAEKELNTGIHMHVAEIAYKNESVTKTREVDHGTVTYLEKIELLQCWQLIPSGSMILRWFKSLAFYHAKIGHSIQSLSGRDWIGFLSKAGVKVSHFPPAAAMRMLGFAPVKEMLDAGICVSLVDEMYLASLLIRTGNLPKGNKQLTLQLCLLRRY